METNGLNFKFPILRNEKKTRELHKARCEKITHLSHTGVPDFCELANNTVRDNRLEFELLKFSGQKGVRAIKTRVNRLMYKYLREIIIKAGYPQGYTTALYLNNFDSINNIMEDSAIAIFMRLNN